MHIFHKWLPWEKYLWEGKVFNLFTGQMQQINEFRQKRSCATCGFSQDRKVES